VAAGCQQGDAGRFALQLTVSAMTAKAALASFRSSCAAAVRSGNEEIALAHFDETGRPCSWAPRAAVRAILWR
jgi:hypothetical protein